MRNDLLLCHWRNRRGVETRETSGGRQRCQNRRRWFHCTAVSTSWADRFSAIRAFPRCPRSRRSAVRRSRPACTWIFSDRAHSYGTRDPFRTGESLRAEIVNEARRLVPRSRLVWSYSGLESTWLENAHFVEVERHPLYTRICA